MRFAALLVALASFSGLALADEKGGFEHPATNSTAGDYDYSGAYPVSPMPQCIENCNIKAGKGLMAEYTRDPKSSDFINSLELECKQGPRRMTFMKDAGLCMSSCSSDDQMQYATLYPSTCKWYDLHKDDPVTKSNTGSSLSVQAATLVSGLLMVLYNLA
ncbi:hypothetical protein K493DRAFT_295445 [Basidiobolus meristosporus CBS 931.73]|uniref:WSC domain-containing protein n=1 Tax=Basidiobolus meristosporus CBS 931.73 TaxID=1314790 RepID=A0A1Y1ZBI1_9FUNG|nr:hypothetical protein K493DRAFT_295445 [Basidiobolus meristosporus CBS 931.73]|eukprot:ORY07641.1 hypothetical protein K493DRAFT_295445 [Basidiobolus meristosporus CBS 931.73]